MNVYYIGGSDEWVHEDVRETYYFEGSGILGDLNIVDRTEYKISSVSSVNFIYPEGRHSADSEGNDVLLQGVFECWILLSTAESGSITVSFPVGTKYAGEIINLAQNGKTFEIYIKDGVVSALEVS